MIITILNGTPDDSYREFEEQLHKLTEDSMHHYNLFKLRDLDIHYCCGCWNCWVKTPGECVFQDDQTQILKSIIQSDLLIFVSPIKMGFISSCLKKVQERCIPLIHPYISIHKNECHHLQRYDKMPDLGLVLIKDGDFDLADAELIKNNFVRFEKNLKQKLMFTVYCNSDIKEVLNHEINNI